MKDMDMDRIINLIIFGTAVYSVSNMFHKEGRWSLKSGLPFFRYFTVLSNTFCGLAALLMVLFPASGLIWLLKYVGTLALTVTMLTVFLFLGRFVAPLAELLKDEQLYMHLITPVLAIVSFLLFERRGLSFLQSLTGLLAVLIYGSVYCYEVVYLKKWEDFYGFNQGGKWYISLPIMLAATFILCLVYSLIA